MKIAGQLVDIPNRRTFPAEVEIADLIRKAQELASKNISTTQVKSYLGAGSYEHFIPSVVNALASRGEFMTRSVP
jgi:glycine dehydrogenase subunit 1